MNSTFSESVAMSQTVSQMDEPTPFFEADHGGFFNFDESMLYYFGVIDIFTEYNAKKKLEHFVKSIKWGNAISCVPPQQYAERFMNFMDERILTEQEFRAVSDEEKKEVYQLI